MILGSVKCREAGEGGIWASSPTHVPPHSQAPKAKRKAESWERSVGTLGSRPQLSGLVVVKRTDLGCSAQEGLASSPTTQGRCRGVLGPGCSALGGRQVAAAPPVWPCSLGESSEWWGEGVVCPEPELWG